jgi:CHAT domain-containing protein
VINHSGDFNLIELGNASVVDSLIQQYRDEINTAGAEVYSPSGLQAEHHLNSISNELFRLLVKPLLSRSEGTRDIIISPDGMLNLIPFGVLADSDSSYMIEHFNVSYVSSGRDIVRFSQNSSLEGEAVLVADPDFDANPSDASLAQASVSGAWANSDQFETLPVMREAPPCLQGVLTRLRYSRKEAALIADILHSQSTLRVQQYQGSEASETVVKDLVIPPAILHLATHGYFCDTAGAAVDPEILVRCGLTLAGANLALEQKAARGGLDDGILTGLEITGLNLVGTRLAALSACETGVGELLSAEGVMGLRRAFQHAGAESILMSLWKVPDSETADLMVEFYRRWLGGEPKRDALRGASLEMLRRCRQERGHGYPLFWGGFILVGNPN